MIWEGARKEKVVLKEVSVGVSKMRHAGSLETTKQFCSSDLCHESTELDSGKGFGWDVICSQRLYASIVTTPCRCANLQVYRDAR